MRALTNLCGNSRMAYFFHEVVANICSYILETNKNWITCCFYGRFLNTEMGGLVISDTNCTSTTARFSTGNLNSLTIISAINLNVTSEGESYIGLFWNLWVLNIKKLHFLFLKTFYWLGVTLVNSTSDLSLYIKVKRKVNFPQGNFV